MDISVIFGILICIIAAILIGFAVPIVLPVNTLLGALLIIIGSILGFSAIAAIFTG